MNFFNEYSRPSKPYGNGPYQSLPNGQSKSTGKKSLPIITHPTGSSAMNAKERKAYFVKMFGNF